MPRVPTVEGPTVALQPVQPVQQTVPQGLGDAGLVRARQAEQASRFAQAFSDTMRREQDELDQVRVDDAINQLKERQLSLTFDKDTGFVQQRGLNALQRPSGQPLAEEYGGELQKTANSLADGLGNERQKRLFGLRSNDIVTGFRGQVMQHEGEQSRVYIDSVRTGTIANRQNEVVAYWNDPVRIDEALTSIEGAVADLGRNLGGKSAEWITARQREETSKAVSGAVGAALERNDFASADALLKAYGQKMTEADLVKSRGTVDKALDAGMALHHATAVVQGLRPSIVPSDFDRVVEITKASESGGRRYGADGQILTSPKGAKGEMQVMDATMAAPGLPGVTPIDPATATPDQRAAFGRQYLGALVRRYDGDMAKAWAAYNAGFGAVDQALTRAGARPGGDWLTFMPAETQAYVTKNVAALQSGEAAIPSPTLQDVHNEIRARIGEGNPNRLKLALDEGTRQYEDMVKADKQRKDEAKAIAQRQLLQNGGRWTLLSPNVRASVNPADVPDLLTFSERVARGEDRTNPAVYQQLSNPDFLKSLSDAQFFTLSTAELSQADRKHFATERGKLLANAMSDKPGDLNTEAVNRTISVRLIELGYGRTVSSASKTDIERMGAIRRYVDRSLLDAQAAAGKKFTDLETVKHIDALFAQTDIASGWFTDSSVPMLTMKVADIPGKVKDKLRADFKAAGIDEPTEGQILGAYWTAKDAAAKRRITPLPRTP